MTMTTLPLDDARATLLRALDELEQAAGELDGDVQRVDLVVIYSLGCESDDEASWHEIGGWASTFGPKWVHTALLRRAADAQDDAARAQDDDDD